MRISIVVFCLAVLSNTIMAQQVSRDEAIKIATRLQMIENDASNYDIENVHCRTYNGDTILLEIDFYNGGFVIISGHKSCEPILGYGTFRENSSLNGIINHYDDIPDGLRTFIDMYESQIRTCFQSGSTIETNPEWNTLLGSQNIPTRQNCLVNPLIETKWGQSASNNGWGHAYNYYVNGIDTNCHDCPAGCVPVAMAQILKYWEEPEENPSWCVQYDWDNMPNELIDDGSSLYVAQRNAVARLIKDCGTSVNVNYCPYNSSCKSGAHTYDVPEALHFFGFNDAVYLEKSDYTQDTWEEMIREELDQGYPILYRGTSSQTSSGHAFICDGYKHPSSTYKYHFNWGWRGDADGWYALTALTPQGSNWTQAQAAVFNIYPSTCWQNIIFECYTLLLQNSYNFHAINTIQNNNLYFAIRNQSSVGFYAGEEIILTDGFYAGDGANFLAKIEACVPDNLDVMANVEGMEERGLGRNGSQNGRTRCVPTTDGTLTLHPNPAHNTLTVESPSAIREITVYDMAGHAVMVEMRCTTSLQQVVNTASLHAGIYLVKVVMANGTETARFVKN